MRALSQEEYEELKLIVNNEDDINNIEKIIINYPVSYETIIRMILAGIDVLEINEICEKCNNSGIQISYWWDSMGIIICFREKIKKFSETIADINFESIRQKALMLGISLNEASSLKEKLNSLAEELHEESNIENHRKKNKKLKNWQHNKFWQK
ncbi:hypothetical protein ACQPUL_08360 [Clostridium butyricum]|uniref:hypothetical protein n=1 Tax=Clostridium butyricum TaxID=1492 RepID=UPI003D337AA3